MSKLPTILVVDDNENYLLYLNIVLKDIHATFITANSALTALEKTRDIELALAILDVQMPIMNGFELALRLNRQRIDNKIPIIFLTATSPNEENVMLGYEVGAVDFIIKPFNIKILLSKVTIFIELFQQKQRVIEKTNYLEISESNLLETQKQLEQVNQHLINAIEEERTNISMKVHDELGQSMTALKMDMNWMRGNLSDRVLSERKLDKMIAMTNEVIKKVQRISLEMHPVMLEYLGLVAAIEWYCKEFEERTAISCALNLEEVDQNSKCTNLSLFRILQEAMTNVMRHSKATVVRIELIQMKDEVYMQISDNGIGISAQQLTSSGSFGLISMRQRARTCGGTLDFSNTHGNGLTIEIRIPKENNP